MKLKKSYLVPILTCIMGFLLFMYPYISDYWNSKNASKTINSYDNSNAIQDKVKKEMLKEAKEYNNLLLKRKDQFRLPKDLKEKYDNLLNIDGNGNIGYIEINAINEVIPIYHYTTEGVLKNNVGHLEWSSLPIGGKSTHAVLSAHTGRVSNKLFTDLWKLKKGDKFVIHVLGERLVYEVDQIKTIEPDDYSYFKIEKGKDLVTLFTCTPYGVNTHRLLVRGHRIKDSKVYSSFAPNGTIINKYIQAGIISILPLCLFIIISIVRNRKRQKRTKI